jgi:hypothetical protein
LFVSDSAREHCATKLVISVGVKTHKPLF